MAKYIVLPRTKLEERIKELEKYYEDNQEKELEGLQLFTWFENIRELDTLKELLKEGTDGLELFEAARESEKIGLVNYFKYPTFEDFNNIKEE